MEEAIRLNKYLSDAGVCSRREADRLIEAGKVLVDGQTASMGMKVAPGQTVVCDGKTVGGKDKPVFLAVNKPRGIVCTTSDKDQAENIVEFLNYPQRIYPVGRLDRDSEGLLLLTNDGALANRLMHPSAEVEKVYRVTVDGYDSGALERLRAVREVDGYRIQPPRVELVRVQGSRAILTVIIHEGRNRQVRKMCAQAALEVRRLVRTAEGPLVLGSQRSGTWRYLTQEEQRQLEELLRP